MIAEKTKITHVALSGGTFQNRLLLKKVVPLLESSGFTVLTHRRIPCNDGGISVGQAVIGSYS
jgi:hydrogenase maturation protein HypF